MTSFVSYDDACTRRNIANLILSKIITFKKFTFSLDNGSNNNVVI